MRTQNDWTLERSQASDLDLLMAWFPSERDIRVWGGPEFRYPFTSQTFREDVRWDNMASFSLYDPTDKFTGFGQTYERVGRINLARLVVDPDRRGTGAGRRLVTMLMSAAARLLPLKEFSLFVYRDNLAALKCYQSLDFEICEYPEDDPLAAEALYMTRLV
ncbi:MAG: GNAT family N-acetyltransferase [Woeseiaceae bacterium]|nr:GNAT family N-acetyltransferase [Woeseiaceae bacterium]